LKEQEIVIMAEKKSKCSPKYLRLKDYRKEYDQYMFEAETKPKKGSQLQKFKEMNSRQAAVKTITV
jgi:hypothetical protein